MSNIFDKLTGLWIPSEIMKLCELTATQKMIMGLAWSFRNGLRLSNTDLSKLLGIDRRNVIYNIQSLRRKGYLMDVGQNKQHRILKFNSDKLPLLDSDKTPPVEQSGSGELPPEVVMPVSPVCPKVVMPVSPISNNILNKVINKGRPNADAFRLAELLLSLILERKSDFRRPDLRQWVKPIDCMLRLDRRTPERIEAVIRWCQQDNGDGQWRGWQDNILSTAKLRQKFDKLELDMRKVDENRNDTIRGCGAGLNPATRPKEFIR